MVSFYRLSQRRLPALIAILAVLLLFIAPDVSKTLESYRTSADSEMSTHHPAEMMMDDMPMPAMSGHAAMIMHAGSAEAMHHDMGRMDEFACGYCQLLVHMPLLLCLFIVFFWLMCLIALIRPALILPAYHVTFFLGICQPRAPPLP
ncbi:DUF2946 domain-containing protein [Candidatus Erwinia dacicola]|uniref:DUF2946 domain-containing protein n=1 Tax=Candidatus Erwinia dacicola TaxID=252393 RepID=A0A1E7Z475_9GAMM|nr:DUF2946 domain-containing protein [Candidatus Erwinia dacicola]OFC63572.1 hypothetical protein BBW68_04815 [Candidatus Erwinia dacicola]RAP71042.1 hypothetical protein ACZ87_02154 [Candidatus Erwinia dacicola]